MKVAVSASSPNLDGQVDPRFGRCPYFLIVDTETWEFEAVENPNVSASGGAGIQSGQLIASKGATAVLTGNCGPNAFQTLSAAGVAVLTGVSGTVRTAVESYLSGSLSQAAEKPSVPSHFGMKSDPNAGSPAPGPDPGIGKDMDQDSGMGRGIGQGMGRGMGGGGGRGMGMGRGMGQGMNAGGSGSAGPADEMKALQDEARSLRDHLEKITEKIAELEQRSRKEPK